MPPTKKLSQIAPGSATANAVAALVDPTITARVAAAVDALVAAAPGALDTLNELAAALGDDPNFAATVTAALAAKLPLAGGTLTGPLVLPADAVAALEAVPKQQVDAAVAGEAAARVAALAGKQDTIPSGTYVQITQRPIDLRDRGVSPANSPTVNTGLIQTAVTEAESTGAPIIASWTPPGEFVNVNDRVLIATGKLKISGPMRIRQTVFPKPVFDVRGPDVEIDGPRLASTPWSATGFDTAFAGETLQVYSAGIWVGASRVAVRNVEADGFICGVRHSNYNLTTGAEGPVLEDCSVENLLVGNLAFGLLVRGVDGFKFSGVRGTYLKMPGSALPPHLIYFTSAVDNTNVVGSDCYSSDGVFGHAYQIKQVKGGVFNNLAARNNFGLLNVMDSSDLEFSNLVSIGDTWTDVNSGTVTIQNTTGSSRVKMKGVTLVLTADGQPVRFGALTSDSVLDDAAIVANHSTLGATDSFEVFIDGTRNTVRNANVRNIGTQPWWSSIGIWSGDGHRIVSPVTAGDKEGVKVRTSATNARVLDYDVADLGVHATLSIRPLTVLSPTTLQRPRLPSSAALNLNRIVAYDLFDKGATSLHQIGDAPSGQTWEWIRGTDWRILNGRLYNNTATSNVLIVLPTGIANAEVSAGITYKDRNSLALRAIDQDNTLLIRPNHVSGFLEIAKGGNAGQTVLASTAFVPVVGRRYHVLARVYGDLIDVFIDGRYMLSHTLVAADQTQFGASVKHGVWGHGSQSGYGYDNFQVRSLA